VASEGLTVRDLHRDDDPKFLDRFYGEVLAASFRPEELDTLESIADGLRGRTNVLSWSRWPWGLVARFLEA